MPSLSSLTKLLPGYRYGKTRKTLYIDRQIRDVLTDELGKGVMSLQEVLDSAQKANQRIVVEEVRSLKDQIDQFIDDIRTAPAGFQKDVSKEEAAKLLDFDTRVMRQCKEVVTASSLLHDKYLKSEPQDVTPEIPLVRKLVVDARGVYRDRLAVLKELEQVQSYV